MDVFHEETDRRKYLEMPGEEIDRPVTQGLWQRSRKSQAET
jgi:hypothetical protein